MDSQIAAPQAHITTVEVGSQRLRVRIRPGKGKGLPLLICNGIGASLELVAPLVEALDGVETITFDVPGTGGSPRPPVPLRFSCLARLTAQMLDRLGYREVDVLGVSWGGGLAQQFALQYPERCRKLILAATSAGAVMVPGRLSAILKLASPRRYFEPAYLASIAPEIYGGDFRKNPELARELGHDGKLPDWLGYHFQMFAVWGWTSIHWLHRLRQPTLVLGGSDDPLVPLINARVLAALIPKAQLHVVDCGHLFLLTRAREVAPIIKQFLI